MGKWHNFRKRKSQSKDTTQANAKKATELAERHPAKPLGGRGKWTLGESGDWREGGAGPEQLRPDLAALPGDLVTKDPSSPMQVHELDPEHIVEDLAYQREKAEREAQKPPTVDEALEPFMAPIGEVVPLSQPRIDLVRFRLMQARINWLCNMEARGVDISAEEDICHVWFPTNNVNEYEMKVGKPPPDAERPPHLRNFHLVVDLLCAPASIRDLLAERGIEIPDFRAIFEAERARRQNSPQHKAVQQMIERQH